MPKKKTKRAIVRKTCVTCGYSKGRAKHFGSHHKTKDGFGHSCLDCLSKKSKASWRKRRKAAPNGKVQVAVTRDGRTTVKSVKAKPPGADVMFTAIRQSLIESRTATERRLKIINAALAAIE